MKRATERIRIEKVIAPILAEARHNVGLSGSELVPLISNATIFGIRDTSLGVPRLAIIPRGVPCIVTGILDKSVTVFLIIPRESASWLVERIKLSGEGLTAYWIDAPVALC